MIEAIRSSKLWLVGVLARSMLANRVGAMYLEACKILSAFVGTSMGTRRLHNLRHHMVRISKASRLPQFMRQELLFLDRWVSFDRTITKFVERDIHSPTRTNLIFDRCSLRYEQRGFIPHLSYSNQLTDLISITSSHSTNLIHLFIPSSIVSLVDNLLFSDPFSVLNLWVSELLISGMIRCYIYIFFFSNI